MLADDLREKLKSVETDLKVLTTFYESQKIASQLADVAVIANNEEFWKHPDRIKLSQQYQHLQEIVDTYKTIVKDQHDLAELIDLFITDEAELKQVGRDIDKHLKKLKEFKLELLLSDPKDLYPCFLTITPGAGGTESQDWASMLLRMYLRFCEKSNFPCDVIDYQAGEEAGIKSATIHIRAKNAYGLLKGEAGIHRLVRISPFDSNKRRHTSFTGITITPEIEDAAIVIKDEEIRIDTYRSGGAGGQHVNKTDSAVRITHIPTGIVVQCQSERSQIQNRQRALKQLMAKLVERREEEKRKALNLVEKKKIEWGSQIRSYVLHPYKMVKDHRTEYESHQPDDVLDGDLLPFIEAFLCTGDNA